MWSMFLMKLIDTNNNKCECNKSVSIEWAVIFVFKKWTKRVAILLAGNKNVYVQLQSLHPRAYTPKQLCITTN